MKLSKAIQAIKTLINVGSRRPIILTSAPGVGKSSAVYQAAEALGMKLIEFRPALHGIEDLVGLPVFNEDKTKSSFATPDWLPKEEDGPGILFLDEIFQAMPAMQNALSQLIHSPHRLHDYQLPDNWVIVCAANRAKDRAATHKAPSHVLDRLTEVEVEFHLEDWVKWARATGIHPMLVGFANWRSNLLNEFDPSNHHNCTPRSLASCSDYVDIDDAEIRNDLLLGTIGRAAATELGAYLSIWQNLPDLDLLIKKPGAVEVPSDPQVLSALTHFLISKSEEDNIEHLIKFIERLPKEYQVLYWKDVLDKVKSSTNTEAFQKFITENSSVLVAAS